MARSTAQKNYINFIGGLITEANPLSYPENTCQVCDNMDLKRDGSLIRRRGIDFERGAVSPLTQTRAAGYWATHVTSVHEWRSVGGIGDLNLLIVQMGDRLHLTTLDTANIYTSSLIPVDATAIGGAAAATEIDLSLVAVGAADAGLDKVQVATGKGAAFVAGPNINPFFIEYHTSTSTYSVHYVGGSAGNILVRDFSGVDDGLAIDTRPTTLSASHQYNLLNQGWNSTNWSSYFSSTSTYPSNSDIWWHGKNSTGNFSPAELNKIWFGAIQAPKGHYIYNAFNIARSGKVAGVANTTTNARPAAIAFYSGRVWYGGVGDAAYSGTLYYSRLIEDPAQDAHKCYMDADPTSEVVSDLVASDGGTITIPEAGAIVKMLALADGVLVFAHNGVWIVKGTSSGGGFSATGYSVVKVSNVGTVSPEAVVEVDGSAMYLARSGIYLITVDQSSLNLVAQNITQTSVQTLIANISDAALPHVKAVYDPLEREVKWFYSNTLSASIIDRADTILTLDTALQAWYTSSVSGGEGTGIPAIVQPFITLPTAATGADYETMVRYIVLVPNSATTTSPYCALPHDPRLVDWYTSNTAGYEYSSVVMSGIELYEDVMRNKQLDDVHVFLKQTETSISNGVFDNPSSCMMSWRFDWATDSSSGKWTTPEQAYKLLRNMNIPSGAGPFTFTYGFDVVATKHNVRGAGRALQVRFESVGSNDMHILGWAVFVSGVTR